MSKIFRFRFSTVLMLLFVSGIFFASCKKDDLPVPQITDIGINNGKDSVNIGDKVVLYPKLNSLADNSYRWLVNGQLQGTRESLAVNTNVAGDYTIDFSATNSSGVITQQYLIHVRGKYENGFFVINEGWFGNSTGNVSFYRYDTKTLEDNVFTKENPGKDLGTSFSAVEYGTVINGKLYLLSKFGGPLVVTDANTMKETARIASNPANDFRTLTAINETTALLSTGNGVYPLNLQTLAIGTKIPDTDGEVVDMVKAGNYIFGLNDNAGLIVINPSTNTVVKKIAGLAVGTAVSKDGNVWVAGGTKLVKISPSTLDTNEVELPFEAFGTFGFWHPGSITASTKENTIYIGANEAYSGATKIYKYVIGNSASLQTVFINLPSGKELYGSGISYDAKKDQLVLSTVKSGYGTNYSTNNLYFYNPSDGSLANEFSYDGYYFPAINVYHP